MSPSPPRVVGWLLGRRRRHKRFALRVRAIIAFGLTALLLSASLAALAYGLVREYLLEERASNATRETYARARVLRRPLADPTTEIPGLLTSISAGAPSSSVLRIENRWFSSSLAAGPDLVPRPLREAVDEGHAGRQRFSHDGDVLLAVGVPITATDAAYFELVKLNDIDGTLEVLLRSLAVAGVAATVIGAAVGASASGAVLRPVRQMAEVAQRIVDGELESRLDAEGDADLAMLVDSFNEMLDDLRDRIQREARFASDVTHELRGPLATLASAVAVVNRRREQLPEAVAVAVDALDAQVRSFNRLVLDLLEISRFDAGTARLDLERVELEAFLRVVLADHGLEHVTISATGEHPLSVTADPRRLQQVISNLIENARRYAGGVLAVAVTIEGGSVRIVVDDAGPGVPEHEREMIFERLARGSLSDQPGAPRGTGLGLALAAEHVQLHGGRLWVEDRPGGGARFVVELPGSP